MANSDTIQELEAEMQRLDRLVEKIPVHPVAGASLAGKLSSRLSSIRSSGGAALFKSSFVAGLRWSDRVCRFR